MVLKKVNNVLALAYPGHKSTFTTEFFKDGTAQVAVRNDAPGFVYAVGKGTTEMMALADLHAKVTKMLEEDHTKLAKELEATSVSLRDRMSNIGRALASPEEIPEANA